MLFFSQDDPQKLKNQYEQSCKERFDELSEAFFINNQKNSSNPYTDESDNIYAPDLRDFARRHPEYKEEIDDILALPKRDDSPFD